jgi:moderate conductance mechanosensitive channel
MTVAEQWFQVTAYAERGMRLLVIVAFAFLMNRLLRQVTRKLIAAAGGDGTGRTARMHEQHTRTIAGVLYSGGTAIILLVAVLMALPEFGFNITPVAAAAGLASLAVGLGAQYLVRDFINGILTVFEDQYVVGDIVRIGDVSGRVEHMTLRRTVVRDAQGALVSIPNGEIGKVANLSRDWAQLFLDTTMAPDQPLGNALDALESVTSEFRADPVWSPMLVDGPRVLGVEALSPAGTTVRVLARTAPTRQDDVARELRRRIQLQLEQRGIRLAGVHRVEFIGKGPAPAAAPEPSNS